MTIEAASATVEGIREDWDRLPLLVGGSLEQGRGLELEVDNPASEEVIARVVTANLPQVDAAVAAARHAFTDGAWSRMSGAARKAAIHCLADVFESFADRFTDALIAEVGTPVAIAKSLQVRWPIEHLRWYASQA